MYMRCNMFKATITGISNFRSHQLCCLENSRCNLLEHFLGKIFYNIEGYLSQGACWSFQKTIQNEYPSPSRRYAFSEFFSLRMVFLQNKEVVRESLIGD
jgi:hypothetical protein